MIKTIDLFAGAGGLSYGFYMTGEYQLVAAAEINENARKTYQKNIANNIPNFVFIENVVGYDFATLNSRLGNGVDVVIGGPPCQGFSNANRQKNHLISMNNGLVKEYFRAIKEMQPKAFVMENVSMLESDTHRFYESRRDNDEINNLISKGHKIPKRVDKLLLSKVSYDGIDMQRLPEMDLSLLLIPEKLSHLLSVLKKNISNSKRLPKFLERYSKVIKKQIGLYEKEIGNSTIEIRAQLLRKLHSIRDAIDNNHLEMITNELDYIVGIQKLVEYVKEIEENGLIGNYEYSEKDGLRFIVNSYSVIDYVNAILGDGYIQKGEVLNAEWFGVPQERKRYIVVGIRKDIYKEKNNEIVFPSKPENFKATTVDDAILDLVPYEVGYKPTYLPISYIQQDNISEYAFQMRKESTSVKNHITSKTTDKALDRFKKIKPGKNFHSLDIEDKDTYSKPERTQNTIYLRLDPAQPCGTVVNVRKSMWIHPTLDRAITVREAARLQSFADKFEFIGTKDSQYQQVGNAVPPLLAKGIAEMILKYVK